MFTGLIEDIGRIARREVHGTGARLTVATSIDLQQVRLGDSVAVNGACLTVVELGASTFTADVSHETLARSAIGRLRENDRVHLERAVRAGDPLGGHIVQGHVDGVGTVERANPVGNAHDVWVRIPTDLHPEIVTKGSIAVDGVSLTVNDVTPTGCRLTIVPHSAARTLILTWGPGHPVNIETDIVGKYVRRMLGLSRAGATTASLLERYGYND